jgi:hypothetical protein
MDEEYLDLREHFKYCYSLAIKEREILKSLRMTGLGLIVTGMLACEKTSNIISKISSYRFKENRSNDD